MRNTSISIVNRAKADVCKEWLIRPDKTRQTGIWPLPSRKVDGAIRCAAEHSEETTKERPLEDKPVKTKPRRTPAEAGSGQRSVDEAPGPSARVEINHLFREGDKTHEEEKDDACCRAGSGAVFNAARAGACSNSSPVIHRLDQRRGERSVGRGSQERNRHAHDSRYRPDALGDD